MEGQRSSKRSSSSQRRRRQQQRLEEEEYYHGLVPREDIKRMLKKTGDFLVRYSEHKGEKFHVISVYWGGQTRHVAVKDVPNSNRVTVQGVEYESIQDVVAQCKDKPITTTSKAKLLNPIGKESWELKHDQIKCLKKLGEGAFGEVYSGTLTLKDDKINVAIKRHRSTEKTISKLEIEELMKESRLMRQYDHPNVVRLYGVAAEQEPIMIVMELIAGGSLDKYLEKHGDTLRTEELTKFCLDAARGMEYLHDKNCIHRDVAARNCLLNDERVVKISDFGLSMEAKEYKMTEAKKVPIRWLAPETLTQAIYSTKTDIYSFGIMMWETFSNGQEPYPGMTVVQVYQDVKSGYRMQPPYRMPSEVTALLKSCWLEQPDSRPNFNKIASELETIYTNLCSSPLF